MKKSLYILLLLLCSLAPLTAQDFPRGAILDEALYESLPRKARQYGKTLDVVLPRAVSLKQYAPYIGDQGKYGTCAAWASAYAARTISESNALGRQDRTETTSSVFSPVFVYKSISDDPECAEGTYIHHALNVLREPGLPRRIPAEANGDFKNVPMSIYRQSPKFPIAGYKALFADYSQISYSAEQIRMIKESLANKKPVVIGMNTPKSFNYAESPWRPPEDPGYLYGGHAMCVVGYDDAKYGGAFEIQNSWGEDWGDRGYIWIQYDVFSLFVKEAYELIENLSARADAAKYSGFVDIEVYRSGKGMAVRYDSRGFYRTVSAWPSGTEFRFILGNDHPAYVYAFAADSSTTKTTRIFPSARNNESPALDYSKNAVAWPGEHDWIRLDTVTGTDYLIVLFSKQELDIDAVRSKFSAGQLPAAPETLAARVAAAVNSTAGPHYISPANIQYEQSRIRFSATSADRNAVMALLLAIEHN